MLKGIGVSGGYGIGKVLKITMTEEEEQQMAESANKLKAFIQDVCRED